MVHGVLLLFWGWGEVVGGHCGLKGQLIVGFVGKISFSLSKYIYSSLCSTNGVSQRVPSQEKSWVGALRKEKAGETGEPPSSGRPEPLLRGPSSRGVQGKLEVFGEVRLPDRGLHSCAEGSRA